MAERLRRISGIARTLCIGACLVLAVHSVGITAQTQQTPSPQDKKSLDDFSRKVKQYSSMKRNLPADKMKATTDVAELEHERETLRQAIMQARPDAKQGDLFTADAAVAFRQLLGQAMTGPGGAKIRASLAHAEPNAAQALTVNGTFPDTGGRPLQSVPGSLLQNLPVLPKGLEYRIVGKTLSLRDADANMVVDFLPNALP